MKSRIETYECDVYETQKERLIMTQSLLDLIQSLNDRGFRRVLRNDAVQDALRYQNNSRLVGYDQQGSGSNSLLFNLY